MTVTVRAGTPVAELHAELEAKGQRTALPERGGTVGGALVVGENDICALGKGRVRESLLQVRYVSAEGRVVTSGGPTVKNVSGFDLPRLIVGSLGTLGLVAEATLRTNPIPPTTRWLRAEAVDTAAVLGAVLAPGAVLTDGTHTWVEIAGHGPDVAVEADSHRTSRALSNRSTGHLNSPSIGGRCGQTKPRHCEIAASTLCLPPGWVWRSLPSRNLVNPATPRSNRSTSVSSRTSTQPAGSTPAATRCIGKDDLVDLGINPDDLNTCVQCGLCLPHCPTFRVTGDETMSPRGRIQLMREVQLHDAPLTDEVLDAFGTCVQCRGCEPACPSGVPYGHLMESTRETLADNKMLTPLWQRLVLKPLVNPVALTVGTRALAVAQRLKVVPERLGLSHEIPIRQPALEPTGSDVYLFTGCVMDTMQRGVHRDALDVLTTMGLRCRANRCAGSVLRRASGPRGSPR